MKASLIQIWIARRGRGTPIDSKISSAEEVPFFHCSAGGTVSRMVFPLPSPRMEGAHHFCIKAAKLLKSIPNEINDRHVARSCPEGQVDPCLAATL